MMANKTIKIKSVPAFESLTSSSNNGSTNSSINSNTTPQKQQFMPAIAQKLVPGNIIWALDGTVFVKCKIVQKIQTGYKLKNLTENYEIKNGTIFSAAQLYSKCD